MHNNAFNARMINTGGAMGILLPVKGSGEAMHDHACNVRYVTMTGPCVITGLMSVKDSGGAMHNNVFNARMTNTGGAMHKKCV